MLRKFMLAIVLAVSTTAAVRPPIAVASAHHATTTAPATTGDLKLFETESGAQRHCPRGEVVCRTLNTNSGIYHEKGMRWYGNTKAGAYVSRGEADSAGDRDTRNGQ